MKDGPLRNKHKKRYSRIAKILIPRLRAALIYKAIAPLVVEVLLLYERICLHVAVNRYFKLQKLRGC